MTASNSSDRRELIVVTGASTGMGAATARELARRGFHVLAGVRRDVDAATGSSRTFWTSPSSQTWPPLRNASRTIRRGCHCGR
jgi:glycine/D-amino acid oxidase-like deaminating enzyme